MDNWPWAGQLAPDVLNSRKLTMGAFGSRHWRHLMLVNGQLAPAGTIGAGQDSWSL
jgi:hypothetical protein